MVEVDDIEPVASSVLNVMLNNVGPGECNRLKKCISTGTRIQMERKCVMHCKENEPSTGTSSGMDMKRIRYQNEMETINAKSIGTEGGVCLGSELKRNVAGTRKRGRVKRKPGTEEATY